MADSAALPHGWTMLVASDVDRDGLALELRNPANDSAAEVFRDELVGTVVVEQYGVAIPVTVWDWFTREAVAFMASFNDPATPLDPAAWTGYNREPSKVAMYLGTE